MTQKINEVLRLSKITCSLVTLLTFAVLVCDACFDQRSIGWVRDFFFPASKLPLVQFDDVRAIRVCVLRLRSEATVVRHKPGGSEYLGAT